MTTLKIGKKSFFCWGVLEKTKFSVTLIFGALSKKGEQEIAFSLDLLLLGLQQIADITGRDPEWALPYAVLHITKTIGFRAKRSLSIVQHKHVVDILLKQKRFLSTKERDLAEFYLPKSLF